MSNQPDVKRAFVFGGTGTVGSAILRELARRSVHARFTYHRSEDRAKMLAAELGHVAVRVDLADGGATTTLLDPLPGALDLAREYLELHMLGGIVCAAIGRA